MKESIRDRLGGSQPERAGVPPYKEVKDRITTVLVSLRVARENQAEYTKIGDMAAIYVLPHEGRNLAVTRGMRLAWNIPLAALHETAMANTWEASPPTLQSLGGLINELAELTEGEPFPDVKDVGPWFVLSNRDNRFGATSLLYPKTKEWLAEFFGGENLYLLPSSVHEFLIVPERYGMNARAMEEMIREVNREIVLKDTSEAYLSDLLYRFDAAELTIKMEEPQKEIHQER